MLKRFFSYYRPYKSLFILDFTCAVIAAIIELAFPVAVNNVIDSILPSGKWSLVIIASLALLLLYVINTAMQYIVTYFGIKI